MSGLSTAEIVADLLALKCEWDPDEVDGQRISMAADRLTELDASVTELIEIHGYLQTDLTVALTFNEALDAEVAAVKAALDDYPPSPSADRSRLFACVSAVAKAVGR